MAYEYLSENNCPKRKAVIDLIINENIQSILFKDILRNVIKEFMGVTVSKNIRGPSLETLKKAIVGKISGDEDGVGIYFTYLYDDGNGSIIIEPPIPESTEEYKKLYYIIKSLNDLPEGEYKIADIEILRLFIISEKDAIKLSDLASPIKDQTGINQSKCIYVERK